MASEIKFPLSFEHGSSQFPPNATCAMCGKRVGEKFGFIRMTAGAIQYDDRSFKNGGLSPLMGALLGLWYHGPADERCCNSEARVDVVLDLPGGQADIVFCSTKCVGSFFDRIVNELHNRIEAADRAFAETED